MKNELARELSLAEGKHQYDNQVKRVLSNKIILAWIYYDIRFSAYLEDPEGTDPAADQCGSAESVLSRIFSYHKRHILWSADDLGPERNRICRQGLR